ncbi:fimbrial protein [Enterobacter sp.]|uniref:fimbrial protein n=1 Tax=Enterobacter sp. TaxID=42895 RepID=UPI00296F4FEB|nr:fimbrial protein [Enterobacter sp.]
MRHSVIKMAQIAVLVAGGLGTVNAMAADGQIRITGEVINKTCTVAINGAPSSTLLNIDPVAAVDLNKDVKSAKGTTYKASRDMRTVNITLESCVLPQGKTKVAVSFDSTGYADAGTSTYTNSLLNSVNTMDVAAKGVQIGFTKINGSDLMMDLNGLDETADYKDTNSGAQTYSFETRYVQTAAKAEDVTAGDIETVATFSVVYL